MHFYDGLSARLISPDAHPSRHRILPRRFHRWHERYILDLIRGLDAAGIQNTIGWLKPGHSTETLESEGVRILRCPLTDASGCAAAEFKEAAVRLLESEKPDLLHFHTFGLTEAALAKLAKQRGIPYAFTYHSPAWTCRRETMLLYGKEPCDGEVRAWRCSACQSEERLGMGRTASAMPPRQSHSPLDGRRCRSVAIHSAVAPHFITIPPGSAALSAVSLWNVIWWFPVATGAAPCSDATARGRRVIVHFPQGVPNAVADALRDNISRSSRGDEAQTKIGYRKSEIGNQFVVGYMGRVTEVKGVHILMEGFSRMEGEEARLRIVGWDAIHTDLPYARRLQQLAQADSRIELVPKKSFADTLAEYQRLSLLGHSFHLDGDRTTHAAGSARSGCARLWVQPAWAVEPAA